MRPAFVWESSGEDLAVADSDAGGTGNGSCSRDAACRALKLHALGKMPLQ